VSDYKERSLEVHYAELEPRPQYRRVRCLCDCGRWFYVARRRGRPYAYATRDCALRSKRRREAARNRE
jgi:hypothetical protein